MLAPVKKELGLGICALLVVALIDTSLPLLLKGGIDALTEGKQSALLIQFAIGYLIFSSLQAGARLGYRSYLGKAQVRSAQEIRSRLSRKILRLPHSQVQKTKSGDLLNRFSSDIDTVSMLCDSGAICMVDAIAYCISMPLAMLFLAPHTTPFVLAPLLCIPLLAKFFDRRIHSTYSSYQKTQDALVSFSQESIRGLRVIKTSASEDSVTSHYQGLGDKSVLAGLQLARVDAVISPLFELVGVIAALILLFVGGQHAFMGLISVGTFVALHKYVQRLLWPMQAIGVTVSLYQRALSSAGRIAEILNLEEETSSPSAAPPAGVHSATHSPLLEYKGVSFSFPGAKQSLLKSVTFQIEAGETLAILGEVGSGKSTLFELAPRIRLPDAGEIFLEGNSLTDLPLNYVRESVFLLPQEPFIFSAALGENVSIAQRTQHALDQELVSALSRASLPVEKSVFPQGLNTLVGERGLTLSGGQRQRLSIARAFVREQKLLIIDDAFAALDSETEQKVFAELRRQSSAIFFSSQRLATILEADRVIVLYGGEIIQQGEPINLSRQKDSWFARFYERQRLLEEVQRYARSS